MSIGVASALAAAYVVLTAGGLVRGHGAELLSDFTLTALPFAAAVACVFAVVRHHGRARLAWTFITASLLAWGTGELLWTVWELVLGEPPFPSVADVAYLSAVPLAAIGIVLFPVVRDGKHSDLRSLVDGVLVSVSVFLVSWVTVLHPLLAAGSGSTVDQAITLAYPLGDIALISIVVFVSGSSYRDREMPLLLIGLGFVGMAVADSGYAYLSLKNVYHSGHPIDAAWVASYAALGLAAFAPGAEQRWAGLHAKLKRVRSSLPYVVAGLAFVSVVYAGRGGAGSPGGPLIYWSPLVIAVLVVSRQFALVLEQKSEALERLRAVDDLKDSFMQAASHEMRTPLTVIKGVAEMLQDPGDLGDEARLSLYANLERNAERLDGLLQSLLDLGRLERGIIVPQRQWTEVDALVARAIEGVDTSTHHVHTYPTGVVAYVDPSQLERIVANLVANAVRHTPPGSMVTVDAAEEDAELILTVDDDGPGVPEDVRVDIFTAFVRAQRPGVETPGTGIGLRIVDQFAQLHGGRAWVEDRPGGGARFRIVLPYRDLDRAGDDDVGDGADPSAGDAIRVA